MLHHKGPCWWAITCWSSSLPTSGVQLCSILGTPSFTLFVLSEACCSTKLHVGPCPHKQSEQDGLLLSHSCTMLQCPTSWSCLVLLHIKTSSPHHIVQQPFCAQLVASVSHWPRPCKARSMGQMKMLHFQVAAAQSHTAPPLQGPKHFVLCLWLIHVHVCAFLRKAQNVSASHGLGPLSGSPGMRRHSQRLESRKTLP